MYDLALRTGTGGRRNKRLIKQKKQDSFERNVLSSAVAHKQLKTSVLLSKKFLTAISYKLMRKMRVVAMPCPYAVPGHTFTGSPRKSQGKQNDLTTCACCSV